MYPFTPYQYQNLLLLSIICLLNLYPFTPYQYQNLLMLSIICLLNMYPFTPSVPNVLLLTICLLNLYPFTPPVPKLLLLTICLLHNMYPFTPSVPNVLLLTICLLNLYPFTPPVPKLLLLTICLHNMYPLTPSVPNVLLLTICWLNWYPFTPPVPGNLPQLKFMGQSNFVDWKSAQYSYCGIVHIAQKFAEISYGIPWVTLSVWFSTMLSSSSIINSLTVLFSIKSLAFSTIEPGNEMYVHYFCRRCMYVRRKNEIW